MTRSLLILLFLQLLIGKPEYIAEGQQLYAAGRYAEAMQRFQRAYEEYPELSRQLWYNMGQCYLRMDSLSAAMAAYDKAMDRTHPYTTSMALNNLGYLQYLNGDNMTALATFKEALKTDPENETARYNYELLKKRMQQPPPSESQSPEQQDNQPPPPDQEPPPPSESDSPPPPQELHLPDEGSGEQAVYQELSLEEAEKLLHGLSEREKQFLQELKKSGKKSHTYDGKNW